MWKAIIFVFTVILASPAAAEETWCWSRDVNAPRTCVYTLKACQEIVRLRRSGICTPSQRLR